MADDKCLTASLAHGINSWVHLFSAMIRVKTG